MTIEFSCSNAACGKTIKVPDSAAGKRARCPHCQAVQAVPAGAGEIPFADADHDLFPKPASPRPAARKAAAPAPARNYFEVPRPDAKRMYPPSKRWMVVLAVVVVALATVGVIIAMVMKNPGKTGKPGESTVATANGSAGNPTAGAQGNPTAGSQVNPTAGAAGTPPSANPTPTPGQHVDPPFIGSNTNYLGALMAAKNTAGLVDAKTQLVEMSKVIARHALMNDEKFPQSLKELVPNEMSDVFLHAPFHKECPAVYISSQSQRSPADNVLIYYTYAYGNRWMAYVTVGGRADHADKQHLTDMLTAQGAKPEEMPK